MLRKVTKVLFYHVFIFVEEELTIYFKDIKIHELGVTLQITDNAGSSTGRQRRLLFAEPSFVAAASSPDNFSLLALSLLCILTRLDTYLNRISLPERSLSVEEAGSLPSLKKSVAYKAEIWCRDRLISTGAKGRLVYNTFP